MRPSIISDCGAVQEMSDSKLSSQEVFQLRLGGLRYKGEIKQVFSKYSFRKERSELEIAQKIRVMEKKPSFADCHMQGDGCKSSFSSQQWLQSLNGPCLYNEVDLYDCKGDSTASNAKLTIHVPGQRDASKFIFDTTDGQKDQTPFASALTQVPLVTSLKGNDACSNRKCLGDSEYRQTLEYVSNSLENHLHSTKSGLMHDLTDDSDSDDCSGSCEIHKQLWTRERICVALHRLAYYNYQPKPDRYWYKILGQVRSHSDLQSSIVTALCRSSIPNQKPISNNVHHRQKNDSNLLELCELLLGALSSSPEALTKLPSKISLFRLAFSMTGFDLEFRRYILDDVKRIMAAKQALCNLSYESNAYDGDARELSNSLSWIQFHS